MGFTNAFLIIWYIIIYNFWMVYMQLWGSYLLYFQHEVTYKHYILYFRYSIDSLYSYLLRHLTSLILSMLMYVSPSISCSFCFMWIVTIWYTDIHIFIVSFDSSDYTISSFNALLPEFSYWNQNYINNLLIVSSAWYTFLISLFLAFWLNEF